MRRLIDYLTRYPYLIAEAVVVMVALVYLIGMIFFNDHLAATFGPFDRSIEQSIAILETGNDFGLFAAFMSLILALALFACILAPFFFLKRHRYNEVLAPYWHALMIILINICLISGVIQAGVTFVLSALLVATLLWAASLKSSSC